MSWERLLGAQQTARYDIFDPTGRYLGDLELPIGAWEWSTRPTFRGPYVAGVVQDEFDVDYVVRLTVERARPRSSSRELVERWSRS